MKTLCVGTINIWTQKNRGMDFALCICNTKAKLVKNNSLIKQGEAMKRIIRSVFASLSAITLILTLSAPIVSSHMQDYYKGFIDTMPENTQVLLEKSKLGQLLVKLKFL